MAHIRVDSKVIANFRNENLIDILQDLIHTELQKPEAEVNSDFIMECVDALLQIEQDEDHSFVPLVPLVKREEFLSSVIGNKRRWSGLNKMARIAIVAAVLAGSTMTANAAVEAVTGVNLLATAGNIVHEKLEDMGIISSSNIDIFIGEDDDEEEIVTEEITETTTAEQESETTTTEPATQSTTKKPNIDIFIGEDDDEEESTTKKPNIDIFIGEDDDDDDETTTEEVTEPSTKPTTSNKPVAPTTEEAVTDRNKPEEKVVLTALSAEYDNFKTDYIYGEELSYDGMMLTAVYSDGSRTPVSVDSCSRTKSLDMNTTADYTLTVTYKSASVRVDITVRPDEETRGSQICSNDDFEYLLTNRGAYITKYKGSEKNLILNTIEGNPVVAICADVFSACDIESVAADNLIKIFDNAFKGCNTLTQVTAPDIEYIGNSAFEGCSQLGKAVYGTNLEYLGSAAYKNTGITELVMPSGINSIPDNLCEGCEKLVSIEFEGDIEEIGDYAFCDCVALERATGTEKIKQVGKYAFYNNSELDFDTQLPQLESVGDYAFAFCNSITFGELPSGVNEIGMWSFAYCYGLTDVSLNEGISIVPESAFRGAHLSSLQLPEGVKEIAPYAFMSTELSVINLPQSLEKIGTYALYSTKLKSVYFGKNVLEIGSNAVYRTQRLTFYVYDDTYPLEYAMNNNIQCSILNE